MTDIQSILESWRLSCLPESLSFEQGNLNNIYFVQDAEGKKYVLRVFRADKRDSIKNYLSSLYETMGLKKYGADIHYRDVAEQVLCMDTFAIKGISTPAVIDHGEDWILMSFADGESLKKLLLNLKGKEMKFPIRSALAALMDVHAKGEHLWDRWGANELIDSKGVVCFIDYDIDIKWPENVSQKTKASFDLSILLRGCIQFSVDKKLAGRTVSAVLRKNKLLKDVYDLRALRNFLDGQAAFYDIQYCQNAQAALSDKAIHRFTNEEIRKINLTLDKISRPVQQLSRNSPPLNTRNERYPQ